jgi:hypothetical protein
MKKEKHGTKLTSTNVKRPNYWDAGLKITDHFLERYKERILDHEIPEKWDRYSITKWVFTDMDKKLLDREKVMIRKYKGIKMVSLPFNRTSQIIIKQNKLVTIY